MTLPDPEIGRTGEGPVLEVTDLAVDFVTDAGWTRVVDDLSFSVDTAETVGIVGESGSGKSVTSLAVMGLIPTPPGRISNGSIKFLGEELTTASNNRIENLRGNEMAMIFQEPMTSLNPAFKVGFQIAEVVERHRGTSRRVAMQRAIEVLDMVGIPKAAQRIGSYPHEFSGGMRQRVMIAMAIACDPNLIIADEPTTALDVTIQAQVLELLAAMRDELDLAVVFITHDLGVVAEVCDRVVVMYAGQVVERAPIDDLYRTPRHPYTEGLLASMPQVEERTGRLASIPGSPPVPWAMPSGCRFHPRCPYSTDACADGDAELVQISVSRSSRCIRVDEIEFRGVTQ